MKNIANDDIYIEDCFGDPLLKREDGICYEWYSDCEGGYWEKIPSILFNIAIKCEHNNT